MFSLIAVSFSAMTASAVTAVHFPGLGDAPWVICAAAAVVFLGSLDAWDGSAPVRIEIDDR